MLSYANMRCDSTTNSVATFTAKWIATCVLCYCTLMVIKTGSFKQENEIAVQPSYNTNEGVRP